MEVVLNFFVGVYDSEFNYVDKASWVLRKYLTSPMGFWFDALTSIPWSWIDIHSYLVTDLSSSPVAGFSLIICMLGQQELNCDSSNQSVTNAQSRTGNERAIRIAKIFRILRIMRVLKMARFVM